MNSAATPLIHLVASGLRPAADSKRYRGPALIRRKRALPGFDFRQLEVD
jgi:hypothetical protein